MSPTPRLRPASRQRGAALLMALIIVTLVTTLATSMVWQQWRSVQVEIADRAHQQAEWMLTGGMDYARLYLKSDTQTSDNLSEVWATPIAESRVSTFMAADQNNTDDAPDAFLAGGITDAQARFNLRGLVDASKGTVEPRTLKVLQNLCSSVSVNPSVALQLAERMRDASNAITVPPPPQAPPNPDPPLMPTRVEQLAWFGIDKESIKRLAPYVVILPEPTPVNLNTAPREVVAAVMGIDIGSAERLVQVRQRSPFMTNEAVDQLLPAPQKIDAELAGIKTKYFFVNGRLRTDSAVLEQRSLIKREGKEITPEWREWVNSSDPG